MHVTTSILTATFKQGTGFALNFQLKFATLHVMLLPITARYSRLEMDITGVRAWLIHYIRWSTGFINNSA
jgi:hypothetical protein